MSKLRGLSVLWAALFVASCVTINVYFPAAAAEKAADRIIEQVLGDDARKNVEPQLKDDSSYRNPDDCIESRLLFWL